MAVGAGVPAALSHGGASPSPVPGAEAAAEAFLVDFESLTPSTGHLAGMSDAALAALLRAPSATAGTALLTADRVGVRARVTGFDVEHATATDVVLLAHVVITTTVGAASTQARELVPIELGHSGSRWMVTDVNGMVARSRLSGQPDPVPAAPPAPATGATAAAPAPASAPDPAAQAGPVQTVSAAGTAGPASTGVSALAVADIPASYLALFEQAALTCPGLPWSVLAGIGKVESDFGRSALAGVHSGANYAGAEGPMQFLPATFGEYAVVGPAGLQPASPYDPPDAIFSAARMLCADGAARPAGLHDAVFAYNHSDAYVALVLAYASEYGSTVVTTAAAGGARLGSVIVADAQSYLGTPYVWGGEKPGMGFDCSGLAQWVYAEAGLAIPRVAQSQYDFGPLLPAGTPLAPGDLVFFGSGPSGVEHVGIYVGNGEMIDAPHTGAVVRYDSINGFDPAYVGATRPEHLDVTSVAGVPVLAPSGGDGSATPQLVSFHHQHQAPTPPPASPWPGPVDTTVSGHEVHETHHHHHAPPPSTSTTDPVPVGGWPQPANPAAPHHPDATTTYTTPPAPAPTAAGPTVTRWRPPAPTTTSPATTTPPTTTAPRPTTTTSRPSTTTAPRPTTTAPPTAGPAPTTSTAPRAATSPSTRPTSSPAPRYHR